MAGTGCKVAVVGTGYVGLSMAVLLAQHNEVTALDIDARKVDQLNARQSPIADELLQEYLQTRPLRLTATLDANAALLGADFIVVATPTDYDPVSNHFDTSTVEQVLQQAL